ncbi:MAG: SPOR domain-containing protein [Candidatus Neomarinimicrobiota bacterium]
MKNFPRSSFSDDATVKLGEYFYARGLYSQACRSLSQFPRKHPRYHDMQRVIDLLVSSFQAVGQNDSAKYYLSIYQGMFPYLDVEKYGINTSNLNPSSTQKENYSNKRSPYVIQIGAFSSLKNAKRLKLQANQIGHEVEIVQVETKDRTLNAVRVIRYNSKTAAEKVGQNIKRKLGVDYRVLYRPING